MRYLQAWLRSVYTPNIDILDKPLSMPSKVKHSLEWWKDSMNVCVGVPFTLSSPTLLLIMEASLIDRAVHLNSHKVQGKWFPSESTLHINLLELKAVRNAYAHFLPLIRDTNTKIMTDNIMYMHYLNCHGGTRSSSQCTEALKLWNWCICQNVLISAAYLLGVQNITAESLSQVLTWPRIENEHKSTPPHIFITEDPNNRLVWYLHEQEMHPLLLQSWPRETLVRGCSPPPFPLMLKDLIKIKREKAKGILIASTWPRQI